MPAREHQMVEHRAVKRFDRAREPAGRAAIGLARLRISTRMIVSEDDAGASVLGRVGDDFAQRKDGAGLVSRVARQMDASRLVVDMGHPQALPGGIAVGEAAGKKLAGGRQTVELKREFGTLISHAASLRARKSTDYFN
jgi:hypothetical protein